MGDALGGVSSELTNKRKELERAKHLIQDLKKIVDQATKLKKEAREGFEAQILEPRDAIKAYQDYLSREQL